MRRNYREEHWIRKEINYWIKKISKVDPLKSEKEDAIFVAVELMYPDRIMERIINSANGIQIDNVLHSGRAA